MRVITDSAAEKIILQRIYIAAYSLFILKYLFGASVIMPLPGIIDRLTNYVFMALILIKIAFQRYTVKQIIGFTVILALCVYSSISARYMSPLLSLLLLVALQDTDLRTVLKFGYRLKAIIIIIHVVCYIALIIFSPDSITFLHRGGVERHSFLLTHPNLFTTIVVWTCLEYIYVNYDKLRVMHVVMIMLINVVFFLYTDSRSGFYTLILVIALIVFDKLRFRPAAALTSSFARFGFGICSLLCIALTVVYTPALTGRIRDIWLLLNNMLTGRLLFGAYSYYTFGMTWLGRTLHTPAKVYYMGHWLDTVIIDNSYQWLMLVYGSVFLAAISAAFFFANKRFSNIEKIVVVGYIIFALMENYTVNVAVCFPLLLIGKCIFEQSPAPGGQAERQQKVEIPLWKRKSAS